MYISNGAFIRVGILMPIHRLDKEKVRQELVRIGWRVNEYGCWQRPTNCDDQQAEADWEQAVICGIGCQHEDTKAETIRIQKESRKELYKGRFEVKKGGDIDSRG
jgi:hypothetical protein